MRLNPGSVHPLRFFFIALVFLLLSAAPVHAATITVSATCSLPNAITAANTDTATNGCPAGSGADTIELGANVTITLGASLPQITTEITINGNGSEIDGDEKYRPFNVSSAGTLTLNNLTIDRAYIARASGTTPHGASIRSLGPLNLDRVVVRNGKTDPDTSSGQHSVGGGGIHVEHNTKISNSAIYNNRSRGEGAGIRIGGGIVTIVNTSIFGNESSHGRGGGIYFGGGTLNLYHSTVTANNPNSSGVSNVGNEAGGGIRAYAGTLSIVNSIIYGNANDDCAIRSAVTISQIAGNIIESGSTSNCTSGQTTDDPNLAGPFGDDLKYYIPRAGSPAIDAISSCITSAINGLSLATDQRGQPRPRLPGTNCDIGAIEHEGYRPPPPPAVVTVISGGDSGGGSGDDDDDDETLAAALASPVSTCLTLVGIAANNLSESTQCQRLNAMQIANPNIKEGDFVDAIDVWSWVTPNTEICFEAAGGSFTFIDTAAMPRTAHEPEAYSKDGMTCAKVDGPGILVLLPGDRPAPAEADAATKAAKAAPAVPAAQSLSNCMVRTQFNLNLRAAPDGEIVGEVPHNSTLTALERTAAWFKVDYHGERGWISAEFVDKKGTCG